MCFGFSAGDFIAALELVTTVINALRESGGASSEYREIVGQLFSLETALLTVKRLEVDPEQHAEFVSLQQAAAQCQRTIDNFWKKKEDVAIFKADLVGHTESIQLLLMAMQMASASLHEKRYDQQSRSLAGKVQDSYFGCMQRLSKIADSLQSGIEQGKKLLVMTTKALVSVLKVNFTKVGHASEVIEKGDFVIQDSATKRDVNLGMEWDRCFSPGQRVEMSMVFKRPIRPTNNCPTCKADCGKPTAEDIESYALF
ncbi:hypothetical protein VE03_07157 [Pseudogymnoascus sp. 23342-1-I1]|nr:hypothetical protein VE03_07157 [Pseudogymnoascus sp. 23342-1-I1]